MPPRTARTRRRAAKSSVGFFDPPSHPTYLGLPKPYQTYLNGLIDEGRASHIAGAHEVAAAVRHQGNFTIASLLVTRPGATTSTQLVAVSKRNCDDDAYDNERGVKIALARAARHAATLVRV